MDAITACIPTVFSQVPAIIWSGVAGSIITIVGVLFSDSRNTRRIKMQLKHDAEEKAKERSFKNRQDVYLKFAEDLMKVQAHLQNQKEIRELTLEEFDEVILNFQSSAARLRLVAELKTVELADALLSGYTAAFLELRTPFKSIQDIHSDIKLIEKEINEPELLKELNQIQTKVIQNKIEEHDKKFYSDTIIMLGEGIAKRNLELKEKLSSLLKDLRSKQRLHATQIQEETEKLSKLEAPLLLSLRNELDISDKTTTTK